MIGLSLFLLFPALLVAGALATHNGSPEMRRLLGGILLAVGLLVMTGSGLCSLAVILSVLGSGDRGGIPFVLLIGGIPFAGGFGLFWWGVRLIRSARRPNDDELRDRFD